MNIRQILAKLFTKQNLFLAVLGFIVSWAIGFDTVKKIIFIAIFMACQVAIDQLDRYLNMPQDFEVATFACVLFAVAYGWKWGFLAGALTKTSGMVANAKITPKHLFTLMSYGLGAILTSFLPLGVTSVGIIVSMVLNIFLYIIGENILKLFKFEMIFKFITNFALSALLFMMLAKPILFLL